MELTVAEGDSVNGIKRLKNGCVSYLSVFIMYKYPSQSYTFLMHNYEDAPQDRLINKTAGEKKLSVCMCAKKENEAEVDTCVLVCTALYCFHHLFPLNIMILLKSHSNFNKFLFTSVLPPLHGTNNKSFFFASIFLLRITKIRKLDKTWVYSVIWLSYGCRKKYAIFTWIFALLMQLISSYKFIFILVDISLWQQ